jgi:hypothetical protein
MAQGYPANVLLKIALVPVFTVLLMLGAVVSLPPFGGVEALRGPTALQSWWWLAFPLQAVLVGAMAYVVARLAGAGLDGQSLSVIILVAWLLELGVAFTHVLPPDLMWADPIDYWAVMTGGPIQPAGAIIGGLLGLGRLMERASQPTT